MLWCDDWRMELEKDNYSCFERLCECRNRKSDILTIASYMYNYNKDNGKEECLDRTIEWITSWNSQDDIEISPMDYIRILSKIK